ncbi:MAG: YceI family protein [Flavobacteriales bacterium]|nr:YceI family protein [Flavobacteriales bacterium]
MKKSILFVGLLGTLFLAACSNSTKTTEAGNEEVAAQSTEEATSYTVNASESSVKWLGAKLFDTKHTGTVAVKEGELSVVNGFIQSGKFVIDMTTITETNNDNAEMAGKLVGHLKSGDFFQVDSFPTASFEVVSVNGNTITGNLTIKGITKSIEIPADVQIAENRLTASSSFTINRNDWGITWGSAAQPIDFLKDNLIKEEIQFDINLVATN